eukprot:GHVS01100787.1.p1 GENE.GHVS01100787.1~~GHVS01100787.1.p1  ORF type:complete len:133 (+),score=23.91 GHVS01100787.1:79-477(+)
MAEVFLRSLGRSIDGLLAKLVQLLEMLENPSSALLPAAVLDWSRLMVSIISSCGYLFQQRLTNEIAAKRPIDNKKTPQRFPIFCQRKAGFLRVSVLCVSVDCVCTTTTNVVRRVVCCLPSDDHSLKLLHTQL